MSMNKKIDNAYLHQYADNAIKRGYEIYDEWIKQKRNSRKIVSSAHSAAKLFKNKKTIAAFVEVLAYIFAIDTHIKEKYNNVLRCLFSYFSWRTETRALSSLKTQLDIPQGEMDIRNLITVEIEKLIEKLEDGWDEDGDDETHGGKRNGKAEEEAADEQKETEEVAEEKNGEKSEEKELAEEEEKQTDSEKEKEEQSIKEELQEEAKEDIAEKTEPTEPQQKDAEVTEVYEKVAVKQENSYNLKEENNAPDVESEPNTDKKEAKSYNDAVDSPPLYEERERERSSEKTSFIDEMIIDDMVKGDKNIIGYRRIDESARNKAADIRQDTAASQNDKNESADKDAYLYDKMIATEKGMAQQTLNANSPKQAEKVTETQTEQAKETVQNNNNTISSEEVFRSVSEKFQQNNINFDFDNNTANALNENMSLESKMSFIRMQEDQMREQIKITLEELGMNDTSDVLRVSEPAPEEVKQATATQNMKK